MGVQRSQCDIQANQQLSAGFSKKWLWLWDSGMLDMEQQVNADQHENSINSTKKHSEYVQSDTRGMSPQGVRNVLCLPNKNA